MSRPQSEIVSSSDPAVAASCLDFLLLELVPLAQRITEQLHARDAALIAEFKRSQIFSKQPSIQSQDATATDKTTAAASVTGATDTTNGGLDDKTREAVFWRLDGMGYRVGQGLVERFSANRPRPQTPLDSIKFVCKDLWQLLFRKPVDNLKTNHRGIFVLTDQRFQPLSRMSVDRKAGPKAKEEALARAQAYLYFPCGIIRGALSGLGMDVTVQADTSELPTATFNIKTKGAKP